MNTKDIANLDTELWDVTTSPDTEKKGLYIAISGNTGAGKSTLIRNVVEHVRNMGIDMLGISERTLHHPYLRRMFLDPGRYSFPVQLNFMLHRHLILLRQVELGRAIFMERSHLDDELFLREHYLEGHVSPAQLNAYSALAQVLHEQVPTPDLLILMNPSPELSVERVGMAELRGDRPQEFPDEKSKCLWIHRWHALYKEFHEQLPQRLEQNPRFVKTRLLTLDPVTPMETRIASVVGILEDMGFLAREKVRVG